MNCVLLLKWISFFSQKKNKTLKVLEKWRKKTRMHSSRMHTICLLTDPGLVPSWHPLYRTPLQTTPHTHTPVVPPGQNSPLLRTALNPC